MHKEEGTTNKNIIKCFAIATVYSPQQTIFREFNKIIFCKLNFDVSYGELHGTVGQKPDA